MTRRKICLFTAHSPLSGGGGTILRSLVNELSDIAITWYYLADSPNAGYEDGYIGKPLMGGSIVNDIWQTYQMLNDKKVQAIENVVEALLKVDCDGYWIVSHNEGLRVALELSRRQKRSLHITVHDDWAGALCARSKRYRFMGASADQMTKATLKAAHSFDVVSKGMQEYYFGLTGKTGQICHRYLAQDSIKYSRETVASLKNEMVAGHIGSIYSTDQFIAFLYMFNDFALAKGKKAMLKMWGCHLSANDIPEVLRNNVIFYKTLPEEEVIPLLTACEFVYAMYPLDNSLHIFSKTSLPTKLTSYLQADRPIFGHGPTDSTLAVFLNENNLGDNWSSAKKEDGFVHLEKVLGLNPSYEELENARKQYFGEDNLKVMRTLLLAD